MKQYLQIIPSILIFTFSFLSLNCFGQDPFIEAGDGLGRYGYLETEATTYTKLNTNGGNWKELAARWFISNEYIYYPGIKSGCDAAGQQTADYVNSNHASWAAGNIAYVSVKARGCDENWNGGVGGQGFNERDFQLIDVSNAGYGGALASNVVETPTGTQNLVGTFSIAAGGASLTLNRLWLFNVGTAEEGTDIPNDGVKLYFENITGTEEYDGTESSRTLFGDYGGNSTTNKEFGSDALGITIPSSGLRVYVVVDKLTNSFTAGRTALLEIINDGISFSESRNGSFNLMRMNTLSTAAAAAILPVQFTNVHAKSNTTDIDLLWRTATETNNAHFKIERSTDSRRWQTLGSVAGAGTTQEAQSYTFTDKSPATGTNYYRVKQVDYDGAFSYSPIVSAKWKSVGVVRLFPNPVADAVRVDLLAWEDIDVTVSLYDMAGRQVLQSTHRGLADIGVGHLPKGAYLLKATQDTDLLFSELLMVE